MAEKPRPEKSLHELRQEANHSRDRLARDLSGLLVGLGFASVGTAEKKNPEG